MGDFLQQALEEQRLKTERREAAAASRATRSERRSSGEGQLPPVDEQQPALRRQHSKASGASGSPMSLTVEDPVLDGPVLTTSA